MKRNDRDHTSNIPFPTSRLILFEDEHVLVVHKPAGINTHAPAPFAGEGLYDWLRHHEPRWAHLSILHRLDKETSGVLLFGKTPLANRALTAQFTAHTVGKRYVLATDRAPRRDSLEVVTTITRAGDKYVVGPRSADSPQARTRFRVLRRAAGWIWVEAEPVTGRTHQIRVQAAAEGFPILGDALYGGASWRRVCLHARELSFIHPSTQELMTFTVEPDFEADPRMVLRDLLINKEETTVYRLVHGAGDDEPGWYVDRLGDYLLSQSEGAGAGEDNESRVAGLRAAVGAEGVYHKRLDRQLRRVQPANASPRLGQGKQAPDRFLVRENGLQFELSFQEGYSVGLFLDQRENRRRFLGNHVAADFPLFPQSPAGAEVLNTFAYTCAFSVCAAVGGARTVSLDLSRKYLEWGRRNFLHNGMDPSAHDFVYGDVFDWLKRWGKKQRRFAAVILDPPTFSQSKTSGVFRAESDYGKLLELALPLLRPDGVLLACTNAASVAPAKFSELVKQVVARRRRILAEHYVPQPFDFPITRAEPAHLKTLWLRIG